MKAALVKWPGANIWHHRRCPQIRSPRTLTDIKYTEMEEVFQTPFESCAIQCIPMLVYAPSEYVQ